MRSRLDESNVSTIFSEHLGTKQLGALESEC